MLWILPWEIWVICPFQPHVCCFRAGTPADAIDLPSYLTETQHKIHMHRTTKRGWADETISNRGCYVTHTQICSVVLHPIVCVQVYGMFEFSHWSMTAALCNNATSNAPSTNRHAFICIVRNMKWKMTYMTRNTNPFGFNVVKKHEDIIKCKHYDKCKHGYKTTV